MYNKEKTTALLSRFFALLCNGSTADSGSVCPGSSPGEATLPTPKVGIFFAHPFTYPCQREEPTANRGDDGSFFFFSGRPGAAQPRPSPTAAPSRFPLLLLAAIPVLNTARMVSDPSPHPTGGCGVTAAIAAACAPS